MDEMTAYKGKSPASWYIIAFLGIIMSLFVALMYSVPSILQGADIFEQVKIWGAFFAFMVLLAYLTYERRKIEKLKVSLSREHLRVNNQTILLQDIAGAETYSEGRYNLLGKAIYLWHNDRRLDLLIEDTDKFMEDLARNMEASGIKIDKKIGRFPGRKAWIWRIDAEKKQKDAPIFKYSRNAVSTILLYAIVTAFAFSSPMRTQSMLSRPDAFLWIFNPVIVGIISVFYLTCIEPSKRKTKGLQFGVGCALSMGLLAYILSNTIYPEASFFYTSPLAVLYYAETLLIPVVVGRLGGHY